LSSDFDFTLRVAFLRYHVYLEFLEKKKSEKMNLSIGTWEKFDQYLIELKLPLNNFKNSSEFMMLVTSFGAQGPNIDNIFLKQIF